MSVLQEVQQRLVLLESKLSDRPEEAGEVRAIRQLLDRDKGEWIGTVEAQRLLGMHSVNTVKAWAKRGWLRSKELPNGRLKVSLEDVLAERKRLDAFAAFPSNDEVTEDERELAKHPIQPELEAIVQDLVEKSIHRAAMRETR